MATHEYEKLITLGSLQTFKTYADELYAKQADLDDVIAMGGEPNTIETVKVNGTALTPDSNKAVNVTIVESTNNGKIKVNGSDVTIHGLGSAAYENTTAFDQSGAAAAVLGSSSDGSSAKTVYGAIALANTKTSNVGTITGVTATTPLTGGGTSGSVTIGIQEATSTQNGYMTSTQAGKLAGIASGATANAATTTTPKMDGTAAVGSETAYAKGDHVHPTDTSRAPLASPAFTGTPTAPTANSGTNTTQIATTAFVQSAISSAQSGAAMFQGTVNSNTTIENSSYKTGWYWVVATSGTYVGQTCEVGDMIYAVANKSTSYSAADFSVVQANVNMSLYVLKTDLLWATDDEVAALFSAA